MQKPIFSFIFKSVLFMGLVCLLPSCKKDKDENLSATYFGTEQTMGRGTIKSFIEVDKAGAPISLGVKFYDASLEGLPTGYETGYSYTLDLPKEVELPPYNHISCDWNEHGHPPMDVYTVPHFDFHNYFISQDERAKIGADDLEQFAHKPAEKFIPAGYELEDGGVPNMGGHFVDETSGEFNGEDFDYTFIFGNYDGNIIFIEPMITMETFQSKKNISIPITQPQAWQRSGYYPKTYGIYYDAETKEHTVVMEGMEWHDGE